MQTETRVALIHEMLTVEEIEFMFHSRRCDEFFSKIAEEDVENRGVKINPLKNKTLAYKAWTGRELIFGKDVSNE